MNMAYMNSSSVIKKDLLPLKNDITDLASELESEEDIEGYDLTPDEPTTF